jgi:4-hydroxyphenylpyruvate dioxygenase
MMNSTATELAPLGGAQPEAALNRSLSTGIATVCLSGTLTDKLEAAARAGFDGIELFENDLIGSPLSPGEVRARATALGLSIDLYQPFRDFEGVSPDQLERNLRRADAKFDVMEKLGATTLLVCSSVAPGSIDDDALAAEQLHLLADHAADRGMRVAYEALAWGRHVSEYDHAWRIVEAADHPALGICLDSFHILSRGTDLDPIGEIPAEKLFFVQLADAPHLVMDVLQWSRHYRCFPGQGGFGIVDFTARVLRAGYEGPLSLEVFNDVFRQADPERMAVDAMRSLLILEEALSQNHSDERLPSPPMLSGYAFIEFAVEPGSVGQMQRLLYALGFSHASQHRTKPVSLWEQDDVRVLLNAGASPVSGVAAIAVESSDPGRSARRAEALLAPVLERDHRPDEADLAAVAAPDGTSIFFCRSDGSANQSWLQDFEPLAPISSREPVGLRWIDHVALAQPFDYFDEAALFYRSVLGLQPSNSLELAAPDGLIRSRAVTSLDDSVRLALNVPVLPVGASAGPQHVAFDCADALRAAKTMADRGIAPLAISPNYYDDLAARSGLEPGLIAAMRGLGVLYDCDDHGEFFHFYTPIVGGRLFFEVVERRGSYHGYGAANAPVRMAAQRSQPQTQEDATREETQ